MPVSHIGLTVSHLPTSCSFFLSALQPLGYRFIGQQGNQIGLGIHEADFFLCQETPGIKAGAAHIAFSAPSRTAVRDFYAAALTAGGRPHGSPACRNEENGYFNAAILDFDGNSVEVVYRDDADDQPAGTVIERSRVLEWRRSVSGSVIDDSRSTTSGMSYRSAAKTVKALSAVAPSIAPSTVVSPPAPVRTASAPSVVQTTSTKSSGDDTAKKIIGTLLGAAAGAAVAYAMCKGEEQSVKDEAEAYAKHAQRLMAPPSEAPQALPPQQQQQRIEYESSPPTRIHRNYSATESVYSSPSHGGALRAIEAPPSRVNYQPPSYTSVAPSRAPTQYQAIEYLPASSVVSMSQAPSKAPSQAPSRAPSKAPSKAPTERSAAPSTIIAPARSSSGRSTHSHSTFISDFVPPSEQPRIVPLTTVDDSKSTVSHKSSKSKAASTYSSASKHSTASKKSKAPSIVGTILGRGTIVEEPDSIDVPLPPSVPSDIDLDNDSVVPEDSISCVSSSRSHRSHRSHSSRKSSSHSHHSHRSRRDSGYDAGPTDESDEAHDDAKSHHSHRSSKSHHSSRSKSSRHSKPPSVARSRTYDDGMPIKPSSVSEASDASTVKPSKSISGRMSSVASIASLPIRALTQSMVDGPSSKKSVVSHAA